MFGLSIAKKIYIPTTLVIVITLVLVAVVANLRLKQIEEKTFADEKHNLEIYLKNKIDEKYDIAITNVLNLATNKDIVSALFYSDENLAETTLTNLVADYSKYSKYKNMKIHIHNKDVSSFVRHWSKKRGDDLKSFRHTINHVKKTQKPLNAIEIGVVGMVLRGIAPIMYQKSYIGSVELIQNFDSVIAEAKQDKGASVVFLMDSSYTKTIAKGLKDAPSFGDEVLSQKTSISDKNLLDEIKNLNLSEKKGSFKTKNYFIV